MRNILFIILILILAAMGFGYYQYLSKTNEENPKVEDIVKNITDADQDKQKKQLTPEDLIPYPIQTSAAKMIVTKNGEINGMATKASDGMTFFTVDLYSDLPQPEDQKYSAWLTGGISPDSYFYLGDLEGDEDRYRINYATGEFYEGMLAYNKIVVSLEDKESDLTKPSSYILEGDFNQQ